MRLEKTIEMMKLHKEMLYITDLQCGFIIFEIFLKSILEEPEQSKP